MKPFVFDHRTDKSKVPGEFWQVDPTLKSVYFETIVRQENFLAVETEANELVPQVP